MAKAPRSGKRKASLVLLIAGLVSAFGSPVAGYIGGWKLALGSFLLPIILLAAAWICRAIDDNRREKIYQDLNKASVIENHHNPIVVDDGKYQERMKLAADHGY